MRNDNNSRTDPLLHEVVQGLHAVLDFPDDGGSADNGVFLGLTRERFHHHPGGGEGFTRAAPSTGGRAKSKFLSIINARLGMPASTLESKIRALKINKHQFKTV